MQKLSEPNQPHAVFKAEGLCPDRKYHFYGQKKEHNIKEFGDLINTVTPIHIRQGSLIHEAAAKLVKLSGETEDYTLPGDVLMYSGVHLQPAFGGTGYSEGLRIFPDFASRLYFMEAEE